MSTNTMTTNAPTRRSKAATPAEPVCHLGLLRGPAQVEFYQKHHDLAVRYGEYEAGQHGQAGVAGLARGVVYSASTEGLAKVALMVGQDGFDPRRAGGRVITFVRFEVRSALHKECGSRGQRCDGYLNMDGRGHPGEEPDPADVVAEADQPAGLDPDEVIERVRQLTDGVVPNGYTDWRELAIRLGMPRGDAYGASLFTLQDEVGRRLRTLLFGPAPDQTHEDDIMPTTDGTDVPPESFVRAWQLGRTVAGVAQRLGMKTAVVRRRADRYRRLGVRLKFMATQTRGRVSPDAVLPSVN